MDMLEIQHIPTLSLIPDYSPSLQGKKRTFRGIFYLENGVKTYPLLR
jgi:hypothetical protein